MGKGWSKVTDYESIIGVIITLSLNPSITVLIGFTQQFF